MTDEFKKARDEANKFAVYMETAKHFPGTTIKQHYENGFRAGADWAYEWCEKRKHEEIAEHANAGVMIGIEQANDKIRALTKEAQALAEALEWALQQKATHNDNWEMKSQKALTRWRAFIKKERAE